MIPTVAGRLLAYLVEYARLSGKSALDKYPAISKVLHRLRGCRCRSGSLELSPTDGSDPGTNIFSLCEQLEDLMWKELCKDMNGLSFQKDGVSNLFKPTPQELCNAQLALWRWGLRELDPRFLRRKITAALGRTLQGGLPVGLLVESDDSNDYVVSPVHSPGFQQADLVGDFTTLPLFKVPEGLVVTSLSVFADERTAGYKKFLAGCFSAYPRLTSLKLQNSMRLEEAEAKWEIGREFPHSVLKDIELDIYGLKSITWFLPAKPVDTNFRLALQQTSELSTIALCSRTVVAAAGHATCTIEVEEVETSFDDSQTHGSTITITQTADSAALPALVIRLPYHNRYDHFDYEENNDQHDQVLRLQGLRTPSICIEGTAGSFEDMQVVDLVLEDIGYSFNGQPVRLEVRHLRLRDNRYQLIEHECTIMGRP